MEEKVIQTKIGEEEARKALAILEKYKQGKKSLDERLIDNEQWWKMRHWDRFEKKNKNGNAIEPASAWLINSLINKHADLWIIIQKRIYCRVRSQTKKQPRFYQMLFRLSWTGTSTLQSIQKRPGRKSKWERAFMECSGMLTRRTVWAISQLKKCDPLKMYWSRELIKSRNPGTCFI